MAHLNKIMLVGHIGQDAKETSGGYAKFSLATSETFKNKEGKFDQSTQWHSVIVFNENLVKYALKNFKKGVMVYVEGKIAYRDIIGKDGNKKSFVDIIVGKRNGDMKIMSWPKEQVKQETKSQPDHNSDSVDKYFDRY